MRKANHSAPNPQKVINRVIIKSVDKPEKLAIATLLQKSLNLHFPIPEFKTLTGIKPIPTSPTNFPNPSNPPHRRAGF